MEGRNTGSPGHLRAARFLAGEFEHAGLKPAGVNGYLQPVKFKVAQIDEEHSSLAMVRDGKVTPLKLGEDANLAVRAGLAENIDAELVFCGYGLSIPEYKFDDFAGPGFEGQDCGVPCRRAVRHSGEFAVALFVPRGALEGDPQRGRDWRGGDRRIRKIWIFRGRVRRYRG